ncbi:MAG: hypothetical protein KIH69_005480, partial [Anaerolineae bacterium]|nr:hypothetical protein [Anaerolineae bacterium]
TSTPTRTPTATATPLPGATSTPTRTPTATPTSATSFPSTGIIDNFNRANGALAAPWFGSLSSYQINGNQLAPTTNGWVFWNANFAANQEAFIKLINTQSSEIGLILKYGVDSQGEIRFINVLFLPYYQSVVVFSYSRVNGLVEVGSETPLAMNAGDQLGARVKSNGQLEIFKNGVMVATRTITDSDVNNNGGQIGILALPTGAMRFDDFGGGSIGAFSRHAASAQDAPAGDAAPSSDSITTDTSPTAAKLQIQVLAQPHSIQNFRFSSDTHMFELDNPAVDDGDGVSDTHEIPLAGTNVITAHLPSTWLLSDIACSPANAVKIDMAARSVVLTSAALQEVRCIFVNQRLSGLTARVFDDINHDGVYDHDESGLAQQQVSLHTRLGILLVEQLSDTEGWVNFSQLQPGNYKLCQTPADGLRSTYPSLDPTLGLSCYEVTLPAGSNAQALFGVHRADAATDAPVISVLRLRVLGVARLDVPFNGAGYDGHSYREAHRQYIPTLHRYRLPYPFSP